MDDSLIAFTGGTGLVGINPGDQNQFVFYFFIDFCQAGRIIADRIFVICGTRAYNDQKFITFPGDDITDFLVSLCF